MGPKLRAGSQSGRLVLPALLPLLALAAALTGCSTWVAQNPPTPVKPVNAVRHRDDARLMLRGYDVVGYFALGQALPGVARYRTEVDGVVYQFASAENLARFQRSPSSHALAYHGFDAMRMVFAIPEAADPNVWLLRDGRVFLFADAASKAAFELDTTGNVALADHYWKAEVAGHDSVWQSLQRRFDRLPHYRSRDELAQAVADAASKPR